MCVVVVVVEDGLLFIAWVGWLCGEWVKGVVWVLCFLSELGCVQFEMCVDGEDACFFV